MLATAVTLIVLNFSGAARGEVGRLWLFMMPLLAIGSAGFFKQSKTSSKLPIIVIGLQIALAISIGAAWRPVRAVIVVAEKPEMPSETVPQFAVNTNFIEPIPQPGVIHLQGYDLIENLTENEERVLDLTLYWESTKPTARPYTVFTHLINANGELIAQQDNWSVQGQWPPTCWQPGETVVDPYHIALPDNLPVGEYSLAIGLYDSLDGSRLHTQNSQEAFIIPDVLKND
jgi:hypothetical protein